MIRIRQGFELRTICGENLIVPLGQHNIDFSKVIYLNDTSMFIWKIIEQGVDSIDEIVEAIMEEYDVDSDTCRNDVADFLNTLKENKVIDYNYVQN